MTTNKYHIDLSKIGIASKSDKLNLVRKLKKFHLNVQAKML